MELTASAVEFVRASTSFRSVGPNSVLETGRAHMQRENVDSSLRGGGASLASSNNAELA